MKAKKMVYVGVNDASYAVTKAEMVNGKSVTLWRCPYYHKWKNMMSRCYSSAVQLLQPTYIGCSVATDWLSFMNFKSWMEKQDWEGNSLDKDILVEYNKVYSPDTCVFVTSKTNSFLTDSKANRGSLPLGVYLKRGKFAAMISRNGRQVHIGSFNSPEEAHQAWRVAKYDLAVELASEQTDPRVAAALIERYKL